MGNRIGIAVIAALILALSGTVVSLADKVHTVTLKKYQLRVDKNKPNEAEALLLSEGGSGGGIVCGAGAGNTAAQDAVACGRTR